MAVVEKDPGVLTEKLVLTRTRAQDLDSVKKLNCWASGITDVSVIRKMVNLEVCSLSGNKIRSLEDFSHCPNLQELYIRKNEISNLRDIHWLKKLNRLRVLWLADNSCSVGDNYRMTVLKTLPTLHKLDNVVVTEDEINRALDEGEELPFPENFITSDSVSGRCLLEKVEMCDELELTREPCEESLPCILKADVTETVNNDSKQRLQNNDESPSKLSEGDSGTQNSGNSPDISRITNNLEPMVENPDKTAESSVDMLSADTQETSTAGAQSLEVTEIPEVRELLRNSVIQSEETEYISSESQVIQPERCSTPILIFEKSHKSESSKDSNEANPESPLEPPHDLRHPENNSAIIKTQTKDEIQKQHQNHRNIPPVALSIEQSNKLREELGLKPIPVNNILSTTKSIQSGITKAKNANILQAMLLLVKDLDKDSLEIVKDVIQTRLDSM